MHQSLFNLFANTVPNISFENNISVLGFITNLIITLTLSLFLSYIYTKFGRSLSNRREFSLNFSPMSMTTMVIITIVKSSLALSLGLVGALSIVRFRTAIKEPEELVYLFLSIAIGLGLGANQTIITIIGFIVIVSYLIVRSRYMKRSEVSYMNLVITYPAPNQEDFENIIEILSSYCSKLNLKRLSDNTGQLEAQLRLEVTNFKRMIEIRNKLNSRYPNINLNFVDTSEIATY
ncbi:MULTISPECIES: DUF4956 domain-containing protein [Prochlorococcus]|uniref:Uncharacterized conserved membrane protein n=1 Tax=Prochlorococcus marinus (strain SARG / CCMP1375 / SS120) TaxID=167539 RepID=Q7VB36_PROMA|nr:MULTISPECIES: DUF4956 domain-containing protein [Prochlorococcus]AAQ00308.1 Uncharacterized conserved membrane protein [Prochlorococcus marinus subsp. marinus str. CCMP1375]KGG14120.1 putative conserved membrane protein [Prochlorococcus marinus str. LG]KGG33335.1 putative conserved membrane protein [Prochlorococcus marinus str. SS51]